MGHVFSANIQDQIGLYLPPIDIIHIESVNKYYQSRSYHYIWWTLCHRAKYIQPILCDHVQVSWKHMYRTMKNIRCTTPLIPTDLQLWSAVLKHCDPTSHHVIVEGKWTLDDLNVRDVNNTRDSWVIEEPLTDELTLFIQLHRENTQWIHDYNLRISPDLILSVGLSLEDTRPGIDGIQGTVQITYLIPGSNISISENKTDYKFYYIDADLDTKSSQCLEQLKALELITDGPGQEISAKPLTCLVSYTVRPIRYDRHRGIWID